MFQNMRKRWHRDNTEFQKWSEKVQSGKRGAGKENREIGGVKKTDPYGIANFLPGRCEGTNLF